MVFYYEDIRIEFTHKGDSTILDISKGVHRITKIIPADKFCFLFEAVREFNQSLKEE